MALAPDTAKASPPDSSTPSVSRLPPIMMTPTVDDNGR